jgi:hypothetical protein
MRFIQEALLGVRAEGKPIRVELPERPVQFGLRRPDQRLDVLAGAAAQARKQPRRRLRVVVDAESVCESSEFRVGPGRNFDAGGRVRVDVLLARGDPRECRGGSNCGQRVR